MMDPDRLRALLALPVPDRRRVAAAFGEAGSGEARAAGVGVGGAGAGEPGADETSGSLPPGEERPARLLFACPPLRGRYEGIDVSWLDPDDPASVACTSRRSTSSGERGTTTRPTTRGPTPGAHYAMHEVVASQLCDGDPPEVWATARRLVADGYERHEVLHMLASAKSPPGGYAGAAVARPEDRGAGASGLRPKPTW